MPCRSQARLELLDDAVALGGRGVDRHEIVVVQVDAPRADLAEHRHGVDRRQRRRDRVAERIAAAVADGPETEGELVFGTRRVLVGHRARSPAGRAASRPGQGFSCGIMQRRERVRLLADADPAQTSNAQPSTWLPPAGGSNRVPSYQGAGVASAFRRKFTAPNRVTGETSMQDRARLLARVGHYALTTAATACRGHVCLDCRSGRPGRDPRRRLELTAPRVRTQAADSCPTGARGRRRRLSRE